MNRLFKYFSIFGILLVFSAYFFRLFEVNGFVKAIAAIESPSRYYQAMGIIYKIDYFFVALIMVSCLASFILMNKENEKTPLFSVSLIPLAVAILEKIYIIGASNIVLKNTMGQNISIVNIVNIVILALGLLSIINSILVKRFMNDRPLFFAFSMFSTISLLGSTFISVYIAVIGTASVHFIIYTVFTLLAISLFIAEFILRYIETPVIEKPVDA